MKKIEFDVEPTEENLDKFLEDVMESFKITNDDGSIKIVLVKDTPHAKDKLRDFMKKKLIKTHF